MLIYTYEWNEVVVIMSSLMCEVTFPHAVHLHCTFCAHVALDFYGSPFVGLSIGYAWLYRLPGRGKILLVANILALVKHSG